MSDKSSSLGEAVLDLAADTKGLKEDIDKAKPETLSALDKLGKAGGALLAAGITIAATAVVGITMLIWNSANTLDAAYDNIQIKTGATGEMLEGLKDDFREVFKEVPDDAGKVSDAIAGLNQRLGMTGPMLQRTAIRLLEMTRITGGDLQTNIDAFTRMMGDAGIANKDAALALDQVFTASQKSGIGIDRLMQLLVQFGAPMRQFGFSLEESIAMLSKWEKEGVNTELVMGSLRIAAGYFAREQIPLQEGLRKSFYEIKNNKDASEALAKAMEVFGARAGPDMAAAIRENRFELGDMVKTLERAGGAIMSTAEATMDWGERLDKFKNKVTTAFEPAGERLMNGATAIMDTIAEVLERPDVQVAIEQISFWIGYLADKVADATPKMVDGFFKFINWLSQNKPIVISILAALGVAIIAFGISVATAAWAALAPMLPVIAIMGLVAAAAYLLYRAWTENWDNIQSKTAQLLRRLSPWIEKFKDRIIAFAESAMMWIQDLAKNIVEATPKIINGFFKFVDWLQKNKPIIVGILAALSVAVINFAIGVATSAIAAGAAVATAAWAAIVPMLPLIGIMALVGVAAYLLYRAWTENWGGIREKTADAIDSINESVATGWKNVQEWTDDAIKYVNDVVEKGLKFLEDMTNGKFGRISAIWNRTLRSFILIMETTMKNLKLAYTAFTQAFEGDWEGFGQTISEMWENIWDTMGVVLADAWESFKDIVALAIIAVADYIKNTDWVGLGKSIINLLASGVQAASGWLYDVFKTLVLSIIESIKDWFSGSGGDNQSMMGGFGGFAPVNIPNVGGSGIGGGALGGSGRLALAGARSMGGGEPVILNNYGRIEIKSDEINSVEDFLRKFR